jgi:hypothetical protein
MTPSKLEAERKRILDQIDDFTLSMDPDEAIDWLDELVAELDGRIDSLREEHQEE